MINKKEFKELLKKRGLTQEQVSEKLGHSASWLSRKISGARKMNCDELLKICEVTGISPQELLGFSMPGPQPVTAEKRISRELYALLPASMVDEIIRLHEEREKQE